MFAPEQWSSYYPKAKGVEVCDIDGRKYINIDINGIGANIPRAVDSDVDNAERNPNQTIKLDKILMP